MYEEELRHMHGRGGQLSLCLGGQLGNGAHDPPGDGGEHGHRDEGKNNAASDPQSGAAGRGNGRRLVCLLYTHTDSLCMSSQCSLA